MAGVGPSEIDCAEVHDCFTITEILDIEDLGFFEKGDGGVASARGRDRRSTGRIPVNTSGGLLAKGHPIGATGVAQITECWWQLRGEAGERQVEMRNGYALQHNAGGRGSGVSRRQHPHEPERSRDGRRTCASRRDADGVGRIVLDRPEAKNALTIAMRDGIIDAVREFRADPQVRAVLITGDGRRVLRGHGPRARRRSRRRASPASTRARPPRRCASACRRSSASSGSSTSRRSPR